MAGATLSLAVSALIRELLLQNWALCSGSFTLTVAQKRVAVFPVTKSDQNTQTVKQNAFLIEQYKTECKFPKKFLLFSLPLSLSGDKYYKKRAEKEMRGLSFLPAS